jgi:hypothetical protein
MHEHSSIDAVTEVLGALSGHICIRHLPSTGQSTQHRDSGQFVRRRGSVQRGDDDRVAACVGWRSIASPNHRKSSVTN